MPRGFFNSFIVAVEVAARCDRNFGDLNAGVRDPDIRSLAKIANKNYFVN